MKYLLVFLAFVTLLIFGRLNTNALYSSCSEYGIWAYQSSPGYCSCMMGYKMSYDIFGNKQCVSMDTLCSNDYGIHSRYNSLYDACECSYGYVFGTNVLGEKQCVNGDSYCHDLLGYNADYDTISKSCVCDDGYVIRDGSCQKKAYTTYATLKELKDYSAIVFYKSPSGFTTKYSQIDFGLGCSKVFDFVGKVVVLNFLYDEKLNRGDYLVLPGTEDFNGDNQHCEIKYVEEVDEYDSLYSCEELFGSHSMEAGNGKCSCEEGYEFSNNKCVEKDDNRGGFVLPAQTYSKELQNAVAWMYLNGLSSFSKVEDFNPEGFLTREQASKFFAQYAIKFLGKEVDPSISTKFDDLFIAGESLRPYIILSNNFGLFKGTNGKFYPFTQLTQAQALAVLIRSSNGAQDESGTLRYSKYYDIAEDLGLLDGLGFNYVTLNKVNIKRKDVALLLYRLVNAN